MNFLWLILGLLIISQVQGQEVNKPNVVIIFADDMGYGDVSGLNPEARTQTRNLDYLIDHGLSFTEAHASASVCTPSRYGLLTGRYAFRSPAYTGISGFGQSVIEEDRRTLAHLFSDLDYSTACVGKWHLGVGWQSRDGKPIKFFKESGKSNVDYTQKINGGPNDVGFDYSYIHTASLDMPPYLFIENGEVVDKDIILTSDVYKSRLEDTQYEWDRKHTREGDVYWRKMVWWRKGEMSKSFRIENCLQEMTQKGVDYIKNIDLAYRDKDKPFFLYLPLTGPHTPWVPGDKFKGKSPLGEYGDFILNIDHVVGQVIDALKEIGEFENTILIFSSDNGGYWPDSEIELTHHDSNYGRRGQKGDVWDGGHHIPLVFHWPNVLEKKIEFNKLTSLTDVYSTLADVLDYQLDETEGEDSFSFAHLLMQRSKKTNRYSMVHQGSNGMFAYRIQKWKFIDGLGSGGFTVPSRVTPTPNGVQGQLYKVSMDPQEVNNLYGEKMKKVDEFKMAMKKLIESE